MSKPVFSDLFTFKSGRRNRRSFALFILVYLAVVSALTASIVVPAYLSAREVSAIVAAHQPLPSPDGFPVLDLVAGVGRLAFAIAAAVAMWAAVAQRFHDLGNSGWAALWLFVPLINFWFLYLLFFRQGAAGPNHFGPDPLGSAPASGVWTREPQSEAEVPQMKTDQLAELKSLNQRLRRAPLVGLGIMLAVFVISVPLIGGGIGYAAPIVAFFAYMIPQRWTRVRHDALVAELGLTPEQLKAALADPTA